MSIKSALSGMAFLCLFQIIGYCQSGESAESKAIAFPHQLLSKLRAQAAGFECQLTQKSASYLQKMQRREERMRRKLSRVDSAAAKELFASSTAQYQALVDKIRTDSGRPDQPRSGIYLPYADSLEGALAFLQKNPSLLSVAQGKLSAAGTTAELQAAGRQFQALQAKMQDAEQIKAFINQRKQQIAQYIRQHANVQQLLGKQLAGMNQDVYYYSQQLRQFKELWNNPNQLEQRALTLLNQLPAFQTFMKNNSQLSGLLRMPMNYGTGAALEGLQTKDQVMAVIQTAAGGPQAMAGLQERIQSSMSQLDATKAKIQQLAQGNSDIDLPDFKPNNQRTKTFLQRLELGTDVQTAKNNYYFPTTTDFGVSLGYKLGHDNILGVGASYKMGWGNGFRHIALSSQGVGLRSFLEVKVRYGLSLSGGLEYNYAQPFSSYQDIRKIERWTQSGLVGLSKRIPAKGKYFKGTKLQLLWDFLSYQQVPKTQPILFRIGQIW